MAKKMTSDDWFGRFQAYEEAADHISMLDWADCEEEYTQGEIVTKHLRTLADKAKAQAHKCLQNEKKQK